MTYTQLQNWIIDIESQATNPPESFGRRPIVVMVDGQEIPLQSHLNSLKDKVVLFTIPYVRDTWWRKITRNIQMEFWSVFGQ